MRELPCGVGCKYQLLRLCRHRPDLTDRDEAVTVRDYDGLHFQQIIVDVIHLKEEDGLRIVRKISASRNSKFFIVLYNLKSEQ